MADVDQSLDGLDLSVALYLWWRVRWLCAAGIRFTALFGMVVSWAPVSTIALTLRCFRMAACIACFFLPMRSERVVALCVGSFDFSTGFLPLDMVVSMADLVSGAACKER